METSKAHIEQHLRNRHPEVTAEAKLERADADAGRASELHEVERLIGVFRKMIARGAECARQTFGFP